MNLWLWKDFGSGFNVAFGTRHIGEQYVNDSNSTGLDAYTTVAAAVWYRMGQYSRDSRST